MLGFEADFDGTMATKSINGALTQGTAQIPWIGTFRGRVGVAFDRLLIYATAGGAATQLFANVNNTPIGSAQTTETHGGWTAGGGLNMASTSTSALVSSTCTWTPEVSTWRPSEAVLRPRSPR